MAALATGSEADFPSPEVPDVNGVQLYFDHPCSQWPKSNGIFK
jgi:hypothetical protein